MLISKRIIVITLITVFVIKPAVFTNEVIPQILDQGVNKDGSTFFDLLVPTGKIETITMSAPAKVPKATLATYKTAGILPCFSTGSADKKTFFVVLYTPIKGGSYSDMGAKKGPGEKLPFETAARIFFPQQQKGWKTVVDLADELETLTPWYLGNNHFMYLVNVPTRPQLIVGDKAIVVPLMNLINIVTKAQESGTYTTVYITDDAGDTYPLLDKFIQGLASSPSYLNALRAIILAENASGKTQLLQEIIIGE